MDTTCGSADTTVYALATGGAPITGVVVVPCADCPTEVVVVSTPPVPPTPKFDREMVTLCTPSGAKVIVQNVTPEDAPLGTAPVFEAWNLNGTPYTGAVAALVSCGADKVNTEHSDYCAVGVNFTRVDGLAEDTGLPVWTVWLDDNGSPVAAPAGAVKGKCETCQPKPCCPREVLYNSGAAPLTKDWRVFAFANYPDISSAFTGVTSAANLYLHALQDNNGSGLILGMNGLPFTNPTTPVLWTNAQGALELYLVAAGLPPRSVILGTDAAGQPLAAINTAVVSPSSIAYWAGSTNTPDSYSNKLPLEQEVAIELFVAPPSCRLIKVVDTLQCDGTYTTAAFELDNTPISGFTPTKIVLACPVQAKRDLIYLHTNNVVLSASDILAATGATKIVSITVKQVSGVGTVSADSGSGVALDSGETWSWGNNESLGSSMLTMDANGGQQRITVIYSI
jgi:hypothetical protein